MFFEGKEKKIGDSFVKEECWNMGEIVGLVFVIRRVFVLFEYDEIGEYVF